MSSSMGTNRWLAGPPKYGRRASQLGCQTLVGWGRLVGLTPRLLSMLIGYGRPL